MSRVRYALCKHGPSHKMRDCGYAHSLSELQFPMRISHKQWHCYAHVRQGQSGIDRFVGQLYSTQQLERICVYLLNEPLESLPSWARMLCWFMQLYSDEYFIADYDFGWEAALRGKIRVYIPVSLTTITISYFLTTISTTDTTTDDYHYNHYSNHVNDYH